MGINLDPRRDRCRPFPPEANQNVDCTSSLPITDNTERRSFTSFSMSAYFGYRAIQLDDLLLLELPVST